MPDQSVPRRGFRGYVTSRPFMGERAPQHIQNLVIRDYADRNRMDYLLSAAEYALDGSQMMLDQVLAELASLQGVICYSIFQLPLQASNRRAVYAKVLEANAELHGAVEGMAVRNDDDIERIEDIWRTRQTLTHSPSAEDIRRLTGGRYG